MPSTFWSAVLEVRGIDLNQGEDPRLGSGRNGSDDKGTLSTTSSNKSSSGASLAATFIPVVVYATVCILIFICLRRRCPRVYNPRALPGLRSPHIPSPALPNGWFNWIKPFFAISDTFILNHGSLDGFFFLRYLKVLRNIYFVGMCISWPILMPVHATGGNGLVQLDMLTLGNVASSKRLYAHVIVAWAFFGFVLFTIARECIYYINIRQAYLSSPHYAKRLSSRTVLLTSVPPQYLDEARLRKLYGDSVKRIWIPRTAKVLVKLVKEREETAMRLEKAEIELIKKANIARNKQLKSRPPGSAPSSTEACRTESHDSVNTRSNNTRSYTRSSQSDEHQLHGIRRVNTGSTRTEEHEVHGIRRVNVEEAENQELEQEEEFKMDAKQTDTTQVTQSPEISPNFVEKAEDPEYTHPYGLDPDLPDVRGSVAAQWIPVQARPHHRPIGNFMRRVDTIRWTRTRLKQLNQQIFKMRRQLRRGDGSALPAAFIEFDTQEAAQAAHQVVSHHRPLQMSPRILGIRPDEVVWSALRMKWWERIIRRFMIMGLITVAIIFWSIPSAFIGVLSNIEFLSTKIFFLKWIGLLPKAIKGFLQGFVPAMALSLWMALVPAMLRFCARQAGVPSLVLVELFTQNAYFAFQVVQVFLITTLTSAASAAFMDILKDPISAKDLLAQNLPKASNFYLSYILIQCLANGATGLLHLFDLLRHTLLGRVAQVPRARFTMWFNLRPPRWGGVYPVFTNMAVIAFSYSCIAPLILIFACVGMAFVRIIYRYNVLYVFDSEMDSKGLFYPRALLQLIVGLYMAEICLVGLFALKFAFSQMVLMLIFSVFTGLVHFSLSEAIQPLLQNLPQTLPLEEEIQQEERAKYNMQLAAESEPRPEGTATDYYDLEQAFGEEEPEPPEDDDDIGPSTDRADRGMEGASSVRSALAEWLKLSTKAKMKTEAEKLKAEAEDSGLMQYINKLNILGDPNDPNQTPGFIQRWLHPEIYEDFIALRKMIPFDGLPNTEYQEDESMCNYWPPELWQPKPILWIPRDEAHVSRQEIAHTKKVTPITDIGVHLDEKGLVVVDVEAAPFPRMRLLY
ncbi:Fc.00g024790.m01.CDS01 [Cosmosporella sp. VM-42]